MEGEVLRAIYSEIHKVELAVLKDNQEKHEDTLDRIHRLAQTVKEHNGVKAQVSSNEKNLSECRDILTKHLTYHKADEKNRSGAFYKATTIIAILIAAASVMIAVLN